MGKRDNSWLRSLGAGDGLAPPVLAIRCEQHGAGRVVAAVTQAVLETGESVYLLHRPDGLGAPLDERHGPVLVQCKCAHAHRLDQAKVLGRIRYGDRFVGVSEVSYRA